MLSDYFDRVYCVNHPIGNRRETIGAELANAGAKHVEYVYAERPPGDFSISNMRRAPSAEFGVNLSHIKAVVRALSDGAKSPVFFEDDIVFLDGWQMRLKSAIASLPEDWDVLYMGGHPCGDVVRVGECLVSVSRFSFAESYAINGKSVLKFFDYWCDRVPKKPGMYDRVLGEFAEKYNGYCVYPVITEQPPGYSYVVRRNDDKRQLIKKAWNNHIPSQGGKAA